MVLYFYSYGYLSLIIKPFSSNRLDYYFATIIVKTNDQFNNTTPIGDNNNFDVGRVSLFILNTLEVN